MHLLRQPRTLRAICRFDAMVAFTFVALVFLIAAGWRLGMVEALARHQVIVLHEAEFIPLSRVESAGV